MMDMLNNFMKERNLPRTLQLRLRDFFRFRRTSRTINDWHVLVSHMSPLLRSEVGSGLGFRVRV